MALARTCAPVNPNSVLSFLACSSAALSALNAGSAPRGRPLFRPLNPCERPLDGIWCMRCSSSGVNTCNESTCINMKLWLLWNYKEVLVILDKLISTPLFMTRYWMLLLSSYIRKWESVNNKSIGRLRVVYHLVGVVRRTFTLAIAVFVASVPTQGCPFRRRQLW